ncbi:MAG: hypothetical protein TE42_02920 [Candidatus Synechococcus spongiarum SP3]|uniref:Uncharacterized protein n=1 Tax=Candidatus Synechococcus spongiarum SP3 TaxID=1604020 RepID=A0A0G2HN30_9SYNE|nr:MAG: hypothetical protein TE42_02920 [Candidatus Synechococcus spongiarum SP3]
MLTGDHPDQLSVAPSERAHVSRVVQTLPRRAAKDFEASSSQCHRGRLALHLAPASGGLAVKHL